MDERELLQGLRAGDEAAFAVLVERYSASLLRVATAIVGTRAVAPERFLPADDDRWPGHWAAPPRSWADTPEGRLLGAEARDLVRAAIDTLPPAQRSVITLRDVVGWTSEEVCDALELSEGNQRVLLHRARSRVRAALERYVDEGASAAAVGVADP